MREVDLELCSSRIVDSAFGIVEADGRAKGFPMDKAKAGANIPKPYKNYYVTAPLISLNNWEDSHEIEAVSMCTHWKYRLPP